MIFKYCINNNQKKFPGLKHVKIKWEEIMKLAKDIELDNAFIHNLHIKFDQETRLFKLTTK